MAFSRLAERLEEAIKAVCPIHGVHIGDPANKATWSFSPNGATAQEISDGNAAIVAFDNSGSAQSTWDAAKFTTEMAAKRAELGCPTTVHTHAPEDINGTAVITTDLRLTDARSPLQHSINGAEHSFPGETTTFLRADGTFANPGGGVDPWTHTTLAGDFSTSSGTAVNATGLSFTPGANKRYRFKAFLLMRTASTTVNPRVGLSWPTGFTDGAAIITVSQAATGTPLFASGNPNAALLTAVGGLPNATQSWPATIEGTLITGSSPSGNVQVQLASESAGTSVTIKAGSWIAFREF